MIEELVTNFPFAMASFIAVVLTVILVVVVWRMRSFRRGLLKKITKLEKINSDNEFEKLALQKQINTLGQSKGRLEKEAADKMGQLKLSVLDGLCEFCGADSLEKFALKFVNKSKQISEVLQRPAPSDVSSNVTDAEIDMHSIGDDNSNDAGDLNSETCNVVVKENKPEVKFQLDLSKE